MFLQGKWCSSNLSTLYVSLCERPVAKSPQITMLFPHRHVSSGGELLLVPQDFLQHLCSVEGNGLQSVSVYGPVKLLLIDLKVDMNRAM